MSYDPSGLAGMIQFRRQESVVVPLYRQVAGEFPPQSFPWLRDIYLSDPDMYSAVNFISNRALSRGYHIECDANVPGHEDAEDFLEDWLRYVRWGDRRNERGFEPLLRISTREMGWGGTTIYEQIPSPDKIEALAQVQLSSIWKFQRNDIGELTAIWQWPHINPRALTPSRYIVSGWNNVDRNPFSYGLIHPVAQPKNNPITGGIIPPLIHIKWQMEDDIRRRMHRYGSPRSIFAVKGLSDAEAKPMAEALANPEADASFIVNTDVGVAMDSPTGRANFGPDLDYIDGRIKSATGNILSEMLTGKGFSYASGVKAGSLADEIVWDLQAVIKTNTENELLQPILEQNGFDANLLKPQFLFNIPDNPQDWTVADLLTAYQTGAISQADFIRNAKQFAKWDLDDPVVMAPSPSAPMVSNPQQNIPNPGNLPTSPGGQIDPNAAANMADVQGLERKRREQMSAGMAGSASVITKPKKKRG